MSVATMPQFTPVARVMEQARFHPAQALPDLTHQSYPFPVMGAKGRLQWVFFFARAEIVVAGAGVQLWPPTYVAWMSGRNGRFDELKSLAPGDFGQRHPTDRPFGKSLTPAERLDPTYLNKRTRWLQALDEIVPYFAARTYGLTTDQQRAAGDFITLMPEVLEAPLMPYYQHAAREFFDWLKLIRR